MKRPVVRSAQRKELRASGTQPPKAVEAHILSTFGAHIVSDAKRLSVASLGKHAVCLQGRGRSWFITFYQEYMDGTTRTP